MAKVIDFKTTMELTRFLMSKTLYAVTDTISPVDRNNVSVRYGSLPVFLVGETAFEELFNDVEDASEYAMKFRLAQIVTEAKSLKDTLDGLNRSQEHDNSDRCTDIPAAEEHPLDMYLQFKPMDDLLHMAGVLASMTGDDPVVTHNRRKLCSYVKLFTFKLFQENLRDRLRDFWEVRTFKDDKNLTADKKLSSEDKAAIKKALTNDDSSADGDETGFSTSGGVAGVPMTGRPDGCWVNGKWTKFDEI